jgi:hypothetical protein
LHPFRCRPQKLKCKAIERWSTLTEGFFCPHFFRDENGMEFRCVKLGHRGTAM